MADAAPGQRESLRAAQLSRLGQLSVSSERQGDVHTICLFGELDLATADAAADEIGRVEADDARSIVLDLSGLTFMDSSGVRLMLTAHARSRGDANRLTMLRGGAAVQRVLEMCGVDRLLPFVD
jgi:stage II sporulation protein AA (anti-sigma F factor antagonist)